jgi:hypothetical protein
MNPTTNTAESHAETSERPPKGFWQNYKPKASGADLTDLSEIPTPTRRRNYHERTQRHYNLIIGKAMTALQTPDCAQDFITGLFTVLGYEVSPNAEVAPGVELSDKEFAAKTVGKTHRLPDDQYKKLVEREAERRRKQRRAIREWQDKPNNPILFDYNGEFNKKTGKNNSIYTLPVAELIRDIIADAPVGSNDARINKAVSIRCSQYLQRFTGANHRPVITREHSASSEMSRGLTLVKNGYAKTYSTELTKFTKESRPDADRLAEEAAVEAFAKAFFDRYPLDRYPLLHTTLLAKLQQELQVKPCTPPSHFAGGPSEIAHEPVQEHASNFGEAGSPAVTLQQSASGLEGESQPQPIQPDEIRALEAFRSVGCTDFETFYLTDETKETHAYDRTTGEKLAGEISEMVHDAERGGDSFIVRARGSVLQLDDCEGITASLLQPFAFAVIETSRGNFQAWLAFNEPEDKAFVAERIFKGVQSIIPSTINHGAGGAIRWPGSINQKPERNGWRIRIHSLNPGRFVTPSELDDAGLLADPARHSFEWNPDGPVGEWPDYQKCLEWKTKDGKTDRSAADMAWVCGAARRGRMVEEISEKLSQVSERAKLSGQKYIDRTITKALAYLRREAAAQ